MVNEEYDLQVLLKLRAKEREEAEARYADALAAHQGVEREVQQLEVEHQRQIRWRVDRCREFDQRLASGPCAIGEVHEFDRYVEGLRDGEERARQQLEEAKRQRRRLRREMEQAQLEMRKALKQLKAVENHYEKWQRRQKLQAKRRQEAKMDDVAARMWRDRRS